MLHCILHKGNLIGLYSDYKKCETMIEGLVSNGFVERKNLEIKSYYENSITVGDYNIDTDSIIEEFTDNNTTDTPKITKLNVVDKKEKVMNEEESKKKSEIQNSIFELKKKKEKLEESKRVYDVNIDLYNKFKKIKEDNEKFEIPEMFIDKYELMNALDTENKLCWENFIELYEPKKIATGYDKIFN